MSEATLFWSSEARLLERLNLKSAALFYAFKNEPLMRRVSRMTRRCFEQTPLPDYNGTRFYPSGHWGPHLPGDDPDGHGLRVHFSGDFFFNAGAFRKLIKSVSDEFEKLLLQRIARDMEVYRAKPQTSRYAHGGMHFVMNFPRLLQDGIKGYQRRVMRQLENAESPEKRLFLEAMQDTLKGLVVLVQRCRDKLAEEYRDNPEPTLKALIAAFDRVPLHPARSFYEAVVVVHFMIYLGCGEPGRLDQYLWHYYEQDRADKVITPREAEELLEQVFATINDFVGSPGAWHLTIGGTDQQGKPTYNELTAICLKLARRYRQPNTSLRVRADMPDEMWELVLDNLKTGCGNPALINDDLYMKHLAEMSGVAAEDVWDYAFGGCTETMIPGKSAADSIEFLYNLLDVLDATVATHLLDAGTFAEFMDAFRDDIRLTVKEAVEQSNLNQHYYALYRTDPVRTLFVDDCIEAGKGYHEGGARYNLSIADVFGLTNTINSLFTIKKLFTAFSEQVGLRYEGELGVSQREFLDALNSNFEGRELLLTRIRNLDKFGNNSPEINALARELTEFLFDEFRQYRCWRGKGYFLPACYGWVDFVHLGKTLQATPDGRLMGEPLADSTGPMQGTDRKGPTETLLSTAAVAQYKALGTCVLNLRLNPQSFETLTQRANLKALIRTYFAQGGAQLQVNVVDQKILKDAMLHPEKHGNLIVRVAGFNDYFVKQMPEIQAEILARPQHGVGS